MHKKIIFSGLILGVLLNYINLNAQVTSAFFNNNPNKVFQRNLETDYYFPSSVQFSSAIPSPAQYLGRQVGHFHTRHDEILGYFNELERTSKRVKLDTIGYTWERRPLVSLIISSEANIAQLDKIKENHINNLNKAKANVGTSSEGQPSISFLGFSVHGNETSAADASLLTAYYLAAGTGTEIEQDLKESVFFIDPVRNPDGYDRYVTWVNANSSFPAVSNPADREHNESWPGGRTNHYWFDLNRDWINQVHPESKARVAYFQKWLPQVQGDFHEMGASSSYFFEPTKPDAQESPWVPKSTFALNNVFAQYYAKALDAIGSLYYTKEQFDNINPTYGSTYPDHAGSLGILFEQASPRGLIQSTDAGELTYPFAIRNHVRIALATIKAITENKSKVQDNQVQFFRSSADLASKDPIKAYIVNAKNKEQTIRNFTSLLANHQIEYSINDQDRTIGTQLYARGKSIIIPTNQANYRLIKVIFDEAKEYVDSVFYDGSGNSLAYLYGFEYAGVKQEINVNKQGDIEMLYPKVNKVELSNYGYLVNWQQDRAPWLLAQLLQEKIIVKVATAAFSANKAGKVYLFSYGSLFIPSTGQDKTSEEIQQIIQKLISKSNLEVVEAQTGFSVSGVDLGSNQFKVVKPTNVLLVTGIGVNASEAGEVWHSFEQELERSLVRINTESLAKANLNNFQVVILVNGDYSNLNKGVTGKLSEWVRSGGTLIAYGRTGQWLTNQQIGNFKFKTTKTKNSDEKSVDKVVKERFNYATAYEKEGAKRIGGAYFNTSIDITHPIGYGYNSSEKAVYRNHALFADLGNQPYNNVAVFAKNPLLNGYSSKDNQKEIEGSSSILVENVDSGRIVYFLEDPLFRGISFHNARSLYNAVFFGQIIRNSQNR